MKICKYYSLDECQNIDLVIEKLNSLQDDSKIEYLFLEDDEVIKIKNLGLSLKEKKEIISFFRDNDIIDYPDYEEFYEEEEEEEEEDY